MSISLALALAAAEITPKLVPLTEREMRVEIIGHDFRARQDGMPFSDVNTLRFRPDGKSVDVSGIHVRSGFTIHIHRNVVELGPQPSTRKYAFFRDRKGRFYMRPIAPEESFPARRIFRENEYGQ